jgi:C_GCAxxG_C_C family probable redox protein
MAGLTDISQRYYKEGNYNCSETLIRAANEYYNLGLHDEDMKMMAGFGGGMFIGGTCGGMTGALAALSKLLVEKKAHEELDVIRPASQLLARNFRQAFGCWDCAHIKPVWNTTEQKCWPTVKKASEVLEQTVEELEKELGRSFR